MTPEALAFIVVSTVAVTGLVVGVSIRRANMPLTRVLGLRVVGLLIAATMVAGITAVLVANPWGTGATPLLAVVSAIVSATLAVRARRAELRGLVALLGLVLAFAVLAVAALTVMR